jgi:hypothetical protein
MRGEGRMVLAGGEVARRTQSGGGIGLPVNNRVFSSSFLLGFWSFDFSSLFYTNFFASFAGAGMDEKPLCQQNKIASL